MRNWTDNEDEHDYGPNELAYLSKDDPKKYAEIVQSNLDEGDTIEKWQRRNLEHMQKFLHNK